MLALWRHRHVAKGTLRMCLMSACLFKAQAGYYHEYASNVKTTKSRVIPSLVVYVSSVLLYFCVNFAIAYLKSSPTTTMLVDEKKDVDYVEMGYDSNAIREQDSHPEQDWTKEEEQAIVKKADWRVFPMLCIVFGLSLLDRTNISAAYIAGLAQDLRLTGQRYNIALLVFFIGMSPWDQVQCVS